MGFRNQRSGIRYQKTISRGGVENNRCLSARSEAESQNPHALLHKMQKGGFETRPYTLDGALFPVKKWGEQQWFNSTRPSTQTYDHAEGLWTTTSESGRVSKTWVDAIHRPLKAEAPGVPTTLYFKRCGQ